jgi:protein-tyrosine phosphatase
MRNRTAGQVFLFLLTVFIAVPALCGPPKRGRFKPPQSDSKELIMQYHSCSHFGGCYGVRILKNGRYETWRGEGQWQLYRQLVDSEMGKLYKAVNKMDFSDLQAEYKPEQRVMDGGSTHYLLPVGDGHKAVTVRKGAEQPIIEAAFKALEDALYWPTYNTVWYVAGEEGIATHRLDCAPDAVPALYDLTIAVARASGQQVKEGPKEGTPLYTVVWFEDGRLESWQEVWQEGWKVYGGPAVKKEVFKLTPEETATVVVAFEKMKWGDAEPQLGRGIWWRWAVPGKIISSVAPERAWGGAVQWERELHVAACYRKLAVLNLRQRADAFVSLKDAEVKHIPIKDFSVPTRQEVDEAIAFIDSSLEAGKIVVVHCLGGCGRTGTILSAWLKKTEDISGDESMSHLRSINKCLVETPEQEAFVREIMFQP